MEAERKKELPIGISDYKNLIDEDCYFIDKTFLIKSIIDTRIGVAAFTRPRRFGKTLNLSMLRYYFGIEEEDNSYLFKDKKIWQEGDYYTKEQGKYPVIFLTFKDVKENNYEKMYSRMSLAIGLMFGEYSYLKNSDRINEREKKTIQKILEDTAIEADYKNSLRVLSSALEKHHKEKVVILMDEYDTPINTAYVNGYQAEAISFMRDLLSGAFKDNSSLKKGVITGINRIAKENIFSGLNNVQVYSVFDNEYADCFGITEPELKDMLEYRSMEFTEDIKKWYDGYNIGGYEIYNPWSVLNYASRRILQPYWVNTASNDLIVECIQNADYTFKENIRKLFDGESIKVVIDKEMIFDKLNVSGNIWGLFINAGYITLSNYETNYTSYNIKIPNNEIRDEFRKIISESANTDFSYLNTMFEALMDGDAKLFIATYRGIVKQVMSFFDTKENAYHMFMLGMCVALKNAYTVKSNLESGDGRSDIICIPKEKKYSPIIMEFKAWGSDEAEATEDKLKNLAEVAIDQIKEKEYYADFENEGYKDTILLGIAHHKKQSCVIMETLAL